ncbi:hypothetical protein WM40_20270 [Robbsia andropogonis]|uniref:F-box domain-containing protein n=2 Tax=Robbsia andropogonis TaxID=28092 RepID=A0A0F5JVN1_9BURK|nr:hypothetical protein WM40_20270 [Robbsia andropogonis]
MISTHIDGGFSIGVATRDIPPIGLSDLPSDPLNYLVTMLPIVDVVALSMTCHKISHVIVGKMSLYAILLPQIAHALTEDVADANVVTVLQAIATLPLPLRPGTLRTFACNLLGPGIDSYSRSTVLQAHEEWERIIAQTRRQISEDASFAYSERLQVDLDIAALRTCCFTGIPSKNRPFYQEFVSRARDIPTRYWPELLDASVATHPMLSWLDLEAFVNDASIRFPCISDRSAIVLANATLSFLGPRTYDVLQTHFGVTAEQCMVLLYPVEAMKIAAQRKELNADYAAVWNLYGDVHPEVVMLAEQSDLALELEYFYCAKPYWQPLGSIGSAEFISEQAAARWRAMASALFQSVETAAITSVWGGNGSPEQKCQSLIDAFTKLTLDMEDPKNVLSCLHNVWRSPLGYQPALLDRWAALIDQDQDNTAYTHILKAISDWRVEMCNTFLLHEKEPVNAVRAYVAELRAWVNISGKREVWGAIAKSLTLHMFERMPTNAWGAMLGYLGESAIVDDPLVEPETLAMWTGVFLKDPAVSLPYTTFNFLMHLCKVAGPIFAELPDKADGLKTKYDRFCERFSLNLVIREQMKQEVLMGVSRRIALTAPRLRMEIKKELANAGFYDEASFVQVLEHQRNLRGANRIS